MLAEGGATTRQLMDTLGHTNIKHAELYSREADQQRLSRDGMGKVVRMFGKGKVGRRLGLAKFGKRLWQTALELIENKGNFGGPGRTRTGTGAVMSSEL